MLTLMFAGLWAIFWKYAVVLVSLALLGGAAWAFPLFRKWLIGAAIMLFVSTIVYTVGVRDGERRVKAQWDAARDAAIEQGERARTDAERDVGDKPAAPGVLDNDPYNRD